MFLPSTSVTKSCAVTSRTGSWTKHGTHSDFEKFISGKISLALSPSGDFRVVVKLSGAVLSFTLAITWLIFWHVAASKATTKLMPCFSRRELAVLANSSAVIFGFAAFAVFKSLIRFVFVTENGFAVYCDLTASERQAATITARSKRLVVIFIDLGFNYALQIGKFLQIFSRAQNDFKHRFDVWNKISFAARRQLKRKCADGFQTALDGLQTKFVSEIGFIQFFKPEFFSFGEKKAAFFGEPFRGGQKRHAVEQQRNQIVSRRADSRVLMVNDFKLAVRPNHQICRVKIAVRQDFCLAFQFP